jgi:exodeoxyribonuclease V beta subunit
MAGTSRVTVAPFDVCGLLPSGITVLEASAGTGKTFAIAALTARYVADGVPLERMLLVTFTRMATGELRERVRQRLVSAQRGLVAAIAGEPVDPDDTVLALLVDGSDGAIELRERRLATAVANFDAATIITTHGFCQQMLASLGIAGNSENDTTLVEDIDELVGETVDDLVTARIRRGATSPLTRSEALVVARYALANPATPLARVGTGPGSPESLRRALAKRVREVVDERKRRARLITYDDLLTRLVAAINDPRGGPAAVARLRQRFHVVLVDEFQDTDELQWNILSTAFSPRRASGRAGPTTGEATALPARPGDPEDRRALVLIGDPKQAIYAFRGADVHAYLAATRQAGHVDTLDLNWRSDQTLIDAYDLLFGEARLGHPDIVHRPVRAAPNHLYPGLEGAPSPTPLRVRVLHRNDGAVALTPQGWASVGSARALIARDLAADVVRLLSARPDLVSRTATGEQVGRHPLHPGDIAVLTSRHRDSTTVRDALATAGVPAVINGAGSVFATPSARDWLLLLEALIRPTSTARVRTVALTPWVGWSAQRVDATDDAAWEELHAACHLWAGVLSRAGVAALLELVTRSTGMPGRLLATEEGERQLTDLRHIGQLLHAEATAESLGTTALTGWLRRRLADAGGDGGTEDRSRRLESDADAVQVLTIYRSKGLEYPVVYAPYLWDPSWVPPAVPAIYHDRAEPGEPRTLDVGGGDGADFTRHKQWDLEEERGEDLRLAYVALTRAKHQAVVWWAASHSSRDSALGRLLFSRAADGTVPPGGKRSPPDAAAAARIEQLGADRPGRLSVERVEVGPVSRWNATDAAIPTLAAATWDRDIDESWRRTSYTGLTSDAHEARVGSEPERGGRSDEDGPDDDSGTVGPSPDVTPAGRGADSTAVAATHDAADQQVAALRAVPLPLAAMPAGAKVGSLIHAVLEVVDFAADDLPGAIAEAISAQSARWPVPLGPPDVAAEGLRAAIETPLGPLTGGRRLADLHRRDRLDELSFELPVAGGEHPSGAVSLADVADLLDDHIDAADPLSSYAARLRDPSLAGSWRGYLTGSLDLVARYPDPSDGTRFVLMDYKTNLLGRGAATVSAWDYRPDALDEAMSRAHYPLQALIYSAALHRYLRWRVIDYEPTQHLGGVLYLFLRGMTGPSVPVVEGKPCGVWAWLPPAALVIALSDLLERGTPT